MQSFVSAENQSNANILSQLETGVNISPNYPSGAVPLNSRFYLKWPSLEKQIIAEIQKAGALVRIKAPQERGKTSLLLRILNTAKQELGYHTVSLNLQKADQNILENLNLFLRWLCVNCAHKLGLQPNLASLRKNIGGRSAGKGRTDSQAKASGFCEAIERYSGFLWRRKLFFRKNPSSSYLFRRR